MIRKGRISLEVTWVTKYGKKILVEGNIVGTYDSDGEFAGTRAVFRDVTERKKIEEEIRKSEEKYRNLFNAMADSAVIVDGKGKILAINIKGITKGNTISFAIIISDFNNLDGLNILYSI